MRGKHLEKETVDVLSPLEGDILAILWKRHEGRVREIYTQLRPKRKVALSSVAVLLDRLYSRGIVDRRVETAQGGPRYIYFPKKDKKEFEQSVVEETVNKLIATFGESALSYFNGRFGK